MRKSKKINLPSVLTVGAVEEILSRYYSVSQGSASVVLDFKYVEWIGFHPASLLFSWVASMLKRDVRVRFEMPPIQKMASQFHKVWIKYGFQEKLVSLGVKSDFRLGGAPEKGVPITIINSKREIKSHSADLLANFNNIPEIGGVYKEKIKDFFGVAFQEISENAFIHGQGNIPYYAASYAISSSKSSNRKGFTTVFEAGTEYIEIVIGDNGPGINEKIRSFVPDDYESFLVTKNGLLKEERILSYAFEAFSTSDEVARKERINALLKGDQISLDQVASGLYFSLQVARKACGQVIVRTPEAILGIDYYRYKGQMYATNKKDLIKSKLAKLPGTHFILRLPLNLVAQNKYIPPATTVSKNIDIRAYDPFKYLFFGDDYVDDVDNALRRVQLAYNSVKDIEGVDLLLQPKSPLTARAFAVCLAGLQLLHKGKRVIVWANRRALSLYEDPDLRESLRSIGMAVVVGDVIDNDFVAIGAHVESVYTYFDVNDNGLLSIKDSYYNSLLEEYLNGTQGQIRDGITSDLILDTDGPFLIEGLYYTEKFYKITSAMKCHMLIQRLSEWIYLQLPEDIELLISASSALEPLCTKVLGEFKNRGKDVGYCEFKYPYSVHKVIPELVKYAGKKNVVITDVICRGDQLKKLLKSIVNTNIDRIIAVVDSRAEYIPGKFNTGVEGKNEFVKLSSVVKDQINPQRDLPCDLKSTKKTYESVKLIDAKTNLPTLHKREIKPKVDIKKLIYTYVKQSGSLLHGHLEYNSKHYTMFLDFPKLFYGMKNEIEQWVKKQIEFLRLKKPHTNKEDVWGFFVYNPDKSLNFIRSSVAKFDLQKSIQEISDKDLNAPPPPKQSFSRCILVLPAISSGHYVRRAIEYVSRYAPEDLSVLCLVSRMEHDHVNFFSNIDRYKGANFHPSYFIDFPVMSYYESSRCPLCTEVQCLEQILNLVRKNSVSDNCLVKFLNNKIKSLNVEVIDYSLLKFGNAPQLTANSLDRAYLHCLYESSDIVLVNRNALNKALLNDVNLIDRFLELYSFEYYNSIFSTKNIQKRLYKAYPRLQERVLELMTRSSKSCPVGKYINAFIAINPRQFFHSAVSLISKNIGSDRDVQETCLGLLKLNLLPPSFVESLTKWKDSASDSSYETLKSTYDILSDSSKTRNSVSDAAITSLAHLYIRFVRSGILTFSVQEFFDAYNRDDSDIDGLLKKANDVYSGWYADDFPELLHNIIGSNLYSSFSKHHPSFETQVDMLEKHVATLSELISVGLAVNVEELLQQVDKIKTSIASLRNLLKDLIVYLPKSILFSQDYSDLRSYSYKKPINIELIRDFSVPLVICDFDKLNHVCEEIISNLQRHGESQTNDVKATFTLKRTASDVIIEVVDNIKSDIDTQSEGGLRIIRRFCSAYGCDLSVTRFDSDSDTKSLSISFPIVGELQKSTSER